MKPDQKVLAMIRQLEAIVDELYTTPEGQQKLTRTLRLPCKVILDPVTGLAVVDQSEAP